MASRSAPRANRCGIPFQPRYQPRRTPRESGSSISLGISNNDLAFWKLHVDFATPGNSTFLGPTAIPVETYTALCAGQQSCGGQCKSVTTDQQNCGSCGNACAAGLSCQNGQCLCSAGLLSCGGMCLSPSAANCGGCGTMCAAGQVCSGNSCKMGCDPGETQCSDGACVPAGGAMATP